MKTKPKPSEYGDGKANEAKLERLSAVSSLALAAIVAVLVFLLVILTIEGVLVAAVLLGDASFEMATGSWETALVVIVVAVAMFIAYLVTKRVYAIFRWRTVLSYAPICAKCGYDLRGNRCGICPECGTPIAPN